MLGRRQRSFGVYNLVLLRADVREIADLGERHIRVLRLLLRKGLIVLGLRLLKRGFGVGRVEIDERLSGPHIGVVLNMDCANGPIHSGGYWCKMSIYLRVVGFFVV